MSEEIEFWICQDCAGVYHIPLDTNHRAKDRMGRMYLISKTGICPMCSEFRQLVKAEPLEKTEIEPEKQEGTECLPLTL